MRSGSDAQSQSMRVLHLGRFLDDNNGGLERHVVQLLDALSTRIEVANLVAYRGFNPFSRVETGPRWKVYRTGTFGVIASTAIAPAMLWSLRRLQKRDGFDLVHLHLPDPLSCLAALTLPRHVPVVASWHSDIIRQKALFRLVEPIVRASLRRCAAVVGATPFHFSDSTQLDSAPAAKRFVIPYGVDFDALQLRRHEKARVQSIRARLGGEFIVLCVGRQVYYKGFDYLIRSMKEWRQGVLVLAGDGPLNAELKALTESLGLGDRVRFLGRVSDAELRLLYHACDVFCLPSIEKAEAFGLVQAEAMSCGRPVVCFNLGNGVTWVNQDGRTGLVAPLRDVSALAACINRLQRDRNLRRKLGAAGRDRVREHLSIRAMGDSMFQLYSNILANSTAPSL